MADNRDPDRLALALFADELRAARERAGWSREDLAARLNYSGSLVRKVESLDRVPHADFADRCDAAFSTPGTFARLQKRLRDLPFPEPFRPFAAFEETATSLRMSEHSLVPGLLQTPEYARDVLATRPNTTDDELEELVSARMQRRAILERENPPMVCAIIDEAALHRPVGGREVMYPQLMRLVEVSGRHNMTLQVLPYSAGGHTGLRGAMIIAGFDGKPSIAFLETAVVGQTVEEPSVVSKAGLIFDTLRSEALSRAASRDLIRKVAEERWT